MKPDSRLTATIDRLISNIPVACNMLREQGYTSLPGQLGWDRDNLVYWQEHGDLTLRPIERDHTTTLETETSIPTPIIKSIHTILLQALTVEVPYSDDPLEMAQAAVDRQREAISQVLTLLIKHCSFPPEETTP